MTQPIENYIPLDLAGHFRRQALRVWAVSSIFVFAWVFAIVLAPLAAAAGYEAVARPVYAFFGYICHQMPSRSFHVEAHQFAVCARCFGVYFGLLAGFAAYPLLRNVQEVEPLPRVWLLLAMIPAGLDWSLGVLGVWENTHLSRFVTGAILGAACAIYIVPALVEIFRLFSKKGRRR